MRYFLQRQRQRRDRTPPAQMELRSNLQRLQAAEARHAFQLTIADRLRPITTPEEVTAAARELLGKPLGVSRVVFSEINDANNTFLIRSDWTDGSLVKDLAERTWSSAESLRAQAELRAERDKGQHIFDTMTEGFTVIDSDWRIRQMNAAGLRIGRRTKREVVGKSLWDIWPEVIGTELETVYRRVMAMRVADTSEQEINFSDGHTASLAIAAYPMLDGGLAAFLRDVTDRNAAIQAVRVSQMRAENALRIAQLGTFEWNAIGNRVDCSPRTREIFGFDDTQGLVADDFFNRIVPADVERVREEIKRSFAVERRLKT